MSGWRSGKGGAAPDLAAAARDQAQSATRASVRSLIPDDPTAVGLWFPRLDASSPRAPLEGHTRIPTKGTCIMGGPLGIEFSEQDRAGIVTLNRPTRLNALSREMFDALSEQYRRWAPNPHIYGLVVE